MVSSVAGLPGEDGICGWHLREPRLKVKGRKGRSMDLASGPGPGSGRQPLGVIPMAIALTAAAFLGGGLGLLIEGGGSRDAGKTATAAQQPAN
jgi:hypothetical protein